MKVRIPQNLAAVRKSLYQKPLIRKSIHATPKCSEVAGRIWSMQQMVCRHSVFYGRENIGNVEWGIRSTDEVGMRRIRRQLAGRQPLISLAT
jgi:hypothetical protein